MRHCKVNIFLATHLHQPHVFPPATSKNSFFSSLIFLFNSHFWNARFISCDIAVWGGGVVNKVYCGGVMGVNCGFFFNFAGLKREANTIYVTR